MVPDCALHRHQHRHRLKQVHPGKGHKLYVSDYVSMCVSLSLFLCACSSFPGSGDENEQTDRPFALIALLHSRQIGVYGGLLFIWFFFLFFFVALFEKGAGDNLLVASSLFLSPFSFSVILSRCLVFPFVEIRGGCTVCVSPRPVLCFYYFLWFGANLAGKNKPR
ncbi:hypothetical protein B0J18DRAFT_114561 [Chaetomium sp. MPI-SDFR-AT-0129]|nr:hypothetical protein B0J18DRAFT_114561 [Chaetomium sp. MPI-SDFR-AT-0129]